MVQQTIFSEHTYTGHQANDGFGCVPITRVIRVPILTNWDKVYLFYAEFVLIL